MMNDQQLYSMPNLGCLLGTAYQRQLSDLSAALTDKGLNVTTAEYLVLRVLYYADGLQQCDIASMIGKDKGAICRCVTAMARKGLIRTESVSHKCLRVYLTDYGRHLEPAIMDIARERHEAFIGLLSPDELQTFVRVLTKMIQK